MSVLQRTTELRPSYVEALTNLTLALAADGRRPEALSAYRKLSRIADGPIERRYFLAHVLEIEGKLAEAEAELRHVLAVAPGQADSRALLAALLLRRGAFEEAERELTRTLDVLPSGFLSLAKANRMTEADRPLIERGPRGLTSTGFRGFTFTLASARLTRTSATARRRYATTISETGSKRCRRPSIARPWRSDST